MSAQPPGSEPLYRIGAVSRLTGIPTDTIRMWERRYGIVSPRRTEGRNRLYGREDIARLALVKRLVDLGNSVGTVATLSMAQLEERLRTDSQGEGLVPGGGENLGPSRIAVLGDALTAQLAQRLAEMKDLEVVLAERDPGQFESRLPEARAHTLLIESPTVGDGTAERVRRLLRRSGAAHAIVIYAFGRRGLLTRLRGPQVSLLRAPVDFGELRQECLRGRPQRTTEPTPGDLEDFRSYLSQPIPGRRFTEDRLAQIASSSTTVECECPHHLADLVYNLAAFEAYSAECENRSEEDAALHAYLHVVTARARHMMEEALGQLAQAENLLAPNGQDRAS